MSKKKINKNKKIKLGLTLDELDILRHLLWDEYWRKDKELSLVRGAFDQEDYGKAYRKQKAEHEKDEAWARLGGGRLYEMEQEKDQLSKLRSAVNKAFDFERADKNA